MKPITSTLEPGNQGSEVANLQDALTILLIRRRLQANNPESRHQLLEDMQVEHDESIYGEITRKIVSIFQEENNLEAYSVVDEQTADALNALLRELGLLNEDGQPPLETQRPCIVSGLVRRNGGLPASNVLVSAVHDDGLAVYRLGQDQTDSEGRYTIRYERFPGIDAIHLHVMVLDEDGQRRAEAIIEAPRPVEVVDLVLQGETFHVNGKLASDIRAGVGNLLVRIVDKNVGGDMTICETTTTVDGSYRTTFTYAGQKQQPDLQARAFSVETFLGASEVRYNASNDETLNVLIEAAADTALATEYETLTGDLATHFAGKLRDLKETDTQQDVTYLANKTGWDARAVALASLADEFSIRTLGPTGEAVIHPALFYALFRAGLPANETALFRTDSTAVASIWKQGIAQGIVPAQLESSIPAALNHFQQLSVQQALNGPAITGLSSLSEMLDISLPQSPDTDDAQHKQFAMLQIQHQGDPVRFWDAVKTAFGEPAAKRLRLDGQLGFLTLNNAPLIAKIHAAAEVPLVDPVNLIELGYYQPERWLTLLDNEVIPPEIAGVDEAEQHTNYADVLATQLRLSYPTATVAMMVKHDKTPTVSGMKDEVYSFLMQHHGQFEIGMQPVEQFIARHQLQLEHLQEVQHEITRIQRVRQITPSDEAMNALLKHGVDSAFAVTQYDRDEFVKAFKDEVGGEANAALIHAKAHQVHNAVLNIATSYLLASNAPGIGVHSPAQIVSPAPTVPELDNVGDVIAYPTLEKIFGEMDYCTCEHCRSILSPAAYLVDLLQFLDRDEVRWGQFLNQWKKDHDDAPYPFGSQEAWNDAGQPADTEKMTPLEVLLSRRPDLQHLPLTCENTNTPLPYIDVVNETLEYFVANGTLKNYIGHNTDDRATPEELIASPQFVQEEAYNLLAGNSNPAPLLPPTPPLPFHQPLVMLRHYFDVFGAPLPHVMEALRKDDAVERASIDGYGWRDIWMEELRLSRAEYARLSDRNLTLQQLYGFTAATTDAEVLTALSNAKAFTRLLDISYEELIEILRTHFINPHGTLIPRLERLGVPLATLKAFKEGVLTDQQFDDALAPHLDANQYGGDIKAWLKKQENYDKIMSLVVLADPSGANTGCSFDKLEFRYTDPARLTNTVRSFEFVRLLRFIRLWKKLGWSIEQTDKALTALYPADQIPNDTDDNINLERLDAGFLVLLPRLGVLRRVIDTLNLNLKNDFLPLLACYAPLDTHGAVSLYRKLFLSPALLKQDPAFADDGYGNVLDGSKHLLEHQEALRAALTLTDDEFMRIVDRLGFDANTPLTVNNVSAIFRRAWLARKLKLSAQEFLLLAQFTGLDPFAPVEPAHPPILHFITLISRLRETGLKPVQALYLIWNQDISGRSAPDARQINEFARSLRAEFTAVESEFAIIDDPDGQIARARMALVYDNTTTDLFFGLLNNTLISEVPYSHSQTTLEKPILDAAPGCIAYDDFRKRLSFTGVMTITIRDALKVGVPLAFENAVDQLYEENQNIIQPFFTRYPELAPFYDTYVSSNDPVEKKRSALLANFLPALKQRRKHQQALQAISATAKTDTALAEAILGSIAVLHAAANTSLPAVDDLTAIEQAGLATKFYFRDTAKDLVDYTSDAEAILDYHAASIKNRPDNKLPDNDGNALSGIWDGYLEVPESGFFNIRIEADAEASVALVLGDTPMVLTRTGNLWRNAKALELRAGTLYAFNLKVEKVKDTLNVQWQTSGRGWEVIPGRYFYSATLCDHLRQTYMRFFKLVSLASALKLTTNELAYLAGHIDYQIGGQGWVNSLPTTGTQDTPTSIALFVALCALLDYSHLKGALAIDDERLLAVLKEPEATAQNSEGPLFKLTSWQKSSLDALLVQFGKVYMDLASLDTFQQVFDAFTWVKQLGISAEALIAGTTNEPKAAMVRGLQAALRARYAESDWLNVLKPINDELRGLQRDALVAYILHQMRASPASAHIDTPDKLFEYFLMDVQMESCMQTSRIRHALSSAQLFIERCLMNLEPRVASSAINSNHWKWMKRYRVWEANRKVFLWPENWLEPELRDDQSPFFKEAMSELLQSDINEDRAAVALLNYLSKLDEVAKLEPCGIHYVENNAGNADDIVYVVARTAGASRKYYYRRREYGYWTPWEQIKLDIEDNPVIPVVWKNRLFLFWLRILKQAPVDSPNPIAAGKDADLTKVKVSQINVTPPQVTVQAMLCWSEYYNDKWQPTKTSDINAPVTLGLFSPIGFDRSELRLSVAIEGDALRVLLSTQGAGSYTTPYGSFLLYNTHSLPIGSEWYSSPMYVSERSRTVSTADSKLTFHYNLGDGRLGIDGWVPSTILHRTVLTNALESQATIPNHLLTDPWDAPFFYEDRRHVFYVTTTKKLVTISDHKGYPGLTPIHSEFSPHIPPLVLQPKPRIRDRLGLISFEQYNGISTPAPIEHFVSEDAYIKRALGTVGTVSFGDKELGLAGALKKQR